MQKIKLFISGAVGAVLCFVEVLFVSAALCYVFVPIVYELKILTVKVYPHILSLFSMWYTLLCIDYKNKIKQ